MFDFAWSEIAVIGVVALIAIGPKDMPAAIKAVTNAMKKARRMAAEFQTHVDEMVREADLHDVRDSLTQIRNFDFKGAVERAVDPDGTIRSTFAGNPLQPEPVIHAPPPVAPEGPASDATAAELTAPHSAEEVVPLAGEPSGSATQEPADDTPAFIPPAYAAARRSPPPDFIPPDIARRRRTRA